MSGRWTSISVLAAGLLASGSPCVAQATGQPAAAVQLKLPLYRQRVIGIFDDDTGKPLDGVEVRDLLGGLSSMTTATGTVALYFLPDGGSMVRLRKIGYVTQTMPIAISPKDTAPITIMMSHAVTLPTVTTTAKSTNPAYASSALRAFEERAKEGMGRYLMYEDIRKNEHMSLADLLRRLGRLEIVFSGKGAYATVAGSSAGNAGLALAPNPNRKRCHATVFLDGVNIGDQDLSALLPTTDIAGVEWYPSAAETPVQFNGTSTGCGVLLIWTRAS